MYPIFGSRQKLSTSCKHLRSLTAWKWMVSMLLRRNITNILVLKLIKIWFWNLQNTWKKLTRKWHGEWKFLQEYAILLGQKKLKLHNHDSSILLYCNNMVIAATRTHKIQIKNIQSLAIKIVNNQTNITNLPIWVILGTNNVHMEYLNIGTVLHLQD